MNAEQRAYWNGPAGERWATGQARMDESLEPVTRELIPFAAPRPGERVLDVGCGCGTTTLRLRDLGCVVAADEGLTIGPLARLASGLDPDARAAIRDRLVSEYARHVTPTGIAPGAAIWLVAARHSSSG